MNTRGRPDLLNILRETLTKHGGVCLAILFGSRAIGRATAPSDLDLAVQASGPLTATDKIALIEERAQTTGQAIDPIDLKQADEPLPGQILKHGERLPGHDEDYAALQSRHLFDAAGFLPSLNCILAGKRLL